jgi:hypothetical protein
MQNASTMISARNPWGASIPDDINTVLQRSDTCDYYVGAAVIRDTKN